MSMVSLTLGSTVRFSDYHRIFKTADGQTVYETTATAYPEDNSTVGFTSRAQVFLTGKNATTLSHQKGIDIHGNVTESFARIISSGGVEVFSTVKDSGIFSIDQTYMGMPVMNHRGTGITQGTFDSLGRLSFTKDFRAGGATRYDYRPGEGRVWKVTTGLNSVNGSLPSTANGEGQTTEFVYDAAGRLDARIDALGQSTYFSYNTRDQLTHRWGAKVQPLKYDYDFLGQLHRSHTFRVDPNKSGAVDFSGASWPAGAQGDVTTYDYFDAAGLLKSETDAKSRVTSYTYDQRGRLRTRTTPGAFADAQTVTTNAITTAYSYFPKTGQLSGVTYTGESQERWLR